MAPPNRQEPEDVHFLGIRVHRVTMPQTMTILERFLAEGTPRQVVTADASGVVVAQRDADLRQLYNMADLVTPDSAGLLWAARMFGSPLPARVSGVDIVAELCQLSHEKGYRLFFLGAAPGIAELARDRLKERFPCLQVVGCRDGFFEDDAEVVRVIREARPDVLLVAMGIPRQEKWIGRHMAECGAAVNIGVGGSFDVFSGTVKRAPMWMRRINCEWLWRLVQNPRKIGKVMTLPRFVWMVLRGR